MSRVRHLAPAAPHRYVHDNRDFMDETFDCIRSVRDDRFRYIRNYRPDLPHSQRIAYMELGGTMQAWWQAHEEGSLNDVQATFLASRKLAEELYDCENDPFETKKSSIFSRPCRPARRLARGNESMAEGDE